MKKKENKSNFVPAAKTMSVVLDEEMDLKLEVLNERTMKHSACSQYIRMEEINKKYLPTANKILLDIPPLT